ncbi:MAG: NAD(P)/FAD-dependent oxidoreductase [Actinobacteria bacterium]|nr:NAD(P)/FAD-dependent oxidoreductase [Actinomycetota bacterium]
MDSNSDVVIIGSGHNALIAAAYLGLAGLSVTLLEEREVPGGATVTEELTGPGYLQDTCASTHALLQVNPVISHDELGLVANGLRYAEPEQIMVVHCNDGATVTMSRNVDVTAAELARFSEADADAFRQVVADWDEVLGLYLQTIAAPPGVTSEPSPAVAKLASLLRSTAAELMRDRFEDEHSRALLSWLAGVSLQPFQNPGTAMALTSVAGMFSRFSWPVAVGGSGALVEALVAVVEGNGGRLLCGRRVDRIIVEHGRAVAVSTADGERFGAARAVVSSANAVDLPDLLGPGCLPPEFDRLSRWQTGASILVMHLALEQIPTYETAAGRTPVVIGSFGSPDGMSAQFRDVVEGRLSGDDRMMTAMCSSLIDPTRAPAGCATMKITTPAPYLLHGDATNWDREKEGYADRLLGVYASKTDGYEPGSEVARAVHSPLDMERRNRNLRGGSTTAGDMIADQMGPNRPVPGWAGYRMPVEGLYQTGATTHPGGMVTGFPGRNAARVVLEDLGFDPSEWMQPPSLAALTR